MDLIIYTLKSVSSAIVEPLHFLMLVILGVIFYFKNIKIVAIQKMTIGEKLNSPLELTFSQIVLGILAGVVGSLLLTTLGVTFSENSGIELIFIVSILLIYFNKRYVCFSYSGAIIGLISIILNLIGNFFGYEPLLNINIVSLITLIGVLHFVEGILVMLDGDRGAMPVFTKKKGQIVGGFSLNRYWAIPISLFMILTSTVSDSSTVTTNIPNWWPLINKTETLSLLSLATMACMPFYGMIGYNSVTFTRKKKEKAISSGISILIYGVSLIAIAQIANIKYIGEIIAIIYTPLAHEFMMRYQKAREEKRDYLYISDDEGITVLEVAPNSPAFQCGIRRGDKILEINGQSIDTEGDIFKAIRGTIFKIPVKVKTTSGKIIEYYIQPKNKRIGVLLVPRIVKISDIVGADTEDFKKILDELRNKK